MKKDTAIGWLLRQRRKDITPIEFQKLLLEALAMEAALLEQAFIDGVDSGNLQDASTYYDREFMGDEEMDKTN